MWRYRCLAMVIVLLLCLCGCEHTAVTQTAEVAGYLLIDPGHGGLDGGTVAQDGTQEKNINLAVGQDLYDLLLVCGFPVKMTRDADVSIHDPDADTTRSKKVSDMHNRLALYEQAALVISVHQNHFSAPQYHGTQVFYSSNHPDSQRLAVSLQRSVVDLLQPENTREIKRATDGIYLLYHTQRPAVLVECGFLSNPAERENLKDPAYRQKLVFAMADGYWKYLIEE